MTEAAKVFHDDIREKKSIKNSASKTNRTGKGPVRFPSDYLSKKEKESLNGECSTWNLKGFYSWDEFKKMPDDIKISWLNHMLNVYGIGIANIESVVFDGKRKILSNWLTDHPEIKQYVNVPPRGGKRSKSILTNFTKAVETWRASEAGESTLDDDGFTEEEKRFITTYIAPISEPKKIEDPMKVNMINPHEKVVEIPRLEAPRIDSMEFSMNGFDMDFLRMIQDRFGDQKVRVCVSVYVEKSMEDNG